MSGALEGTRVVDLTDVKGAWATRLLADFGADVIRVEHPEGDSMRELAPFYHDERDPAKSLTYWLYNAGKRSFPLDLERPEDADTFRKLVGGADILLESQAPRSLQRFGLDYSSLAADNKGLIQVSITPFGQDGPLADCPASDLTLCALGGMMYVNGNPESPPLVAFGQQSYHVASYFGAIAAMAALQARRRTGVGQFIDVSIQAAVAAFIEHVNVWYLYGGRVAKRQGSLHWSRAFATFRALDGFISLSLYHQWDVLVAWLLGDDAAEDLVDERYQDVRWAVERTEHVMEVIGRWAATKTVDELFREGQERRFPWAAVSDIAQACRLPQLEARGFWEAVDHDDIGEEITYPGAPYKLSASPWAVRRRPPLPGEHEAEIRAELAGNGVRAANPTTTSRPTAAAAGALDGVRVLDFTWVLAGPYAARILADLGAEVIKVQSTATARGFTDDPSAPYFNVYNRNKKGIYINMRDPRGIELARKIVANSDVVLDNFSTRVMKQWGMDYDVLKTVKPDIVCCSISGMGASGPWKDYVSFGPTAQALAGFALLTANPGEHPAGFGYSYSDHMAGTVAATAVLAALEHRSRTGEGQYIDTSQLEATAPLIGPALLDYTVNGRAAPAAGNRHLYEPYVPHGAFPCRGDDRWIAIAVTNDQQWKALAALVAEPTWTDGWSASERLRRQDEIEERLAAWTKEQDGPQLMETLCAAGVPAGLVQDAQDLIEKDPQLAHRGFYLSAQHPELGQVRFDGFPPTSRDQVSCCGARRRCWVSTTATYSGAARLAADGVG